MLAEPPAFAAVSKPVEPPILTGTSARWIPDTPDVQSPAPLRATQVIPQIHPQAPRPHAEAAAAAAGGIVDTAAPIGSEMPVFVPPADSQPVSVTQKLRSRRRKRSPTTIVLMCVSGAVVAGSIIGAVLLSRHSADNSNAGNVKSPPQVNQEWQDEKAELAAANEDASALSPTSGEPIPLNYIPFTPHLICHLRPADLWQRDRQMKEFEATLGQVGVWLKEQIRTLSRFEPEEIQELTIAINFGARTMAPDVAAVVRLKDPRTPSDLMKRFQGRIRTDLEADVYESEALSFLMIDTQTFAVAPVTLSDSLAAAKKYPALASPDLDSLMKESDRSRHFTLMFDVNNIDIHREHIFIEPLHRIADLFVLWMGRDIQTVSWSLHLQQDLFMETLLHHSNDSSVLKVRRSIRSQLDELPDQILAATRFMKPSTVGTRQIIGRFPVMLKAVSTATTADIGPQYVRLTTVLPGKAAANLAAGTLLTWNESRVTDFSLTARPSTSTGSIPDKVSERLKLPVLVDFRNFPLQEAMEYIGDVIKTEFVINGDALKGAGFTQVMPQTLNLGTISAEAAIGAILKKYAAERDPMVISVDEKTQIITLTTKSVAEQSGLVIYPVPMPAP